MPALPARRTAFLRLALAAWCLAPPPPVPSLSVMGDARPLWRWLARWHGGARSGLGPKAYQRTVWQSRNASPVICEFARRAVEVSSEWQGLRVCLIVTLILSMRAAK